MSESDLNCVSDIDADEAIVKGMMDVLWAGARLDTFSDLQDMVGAVSVLRPQADDSRVAIAWWHVRNRAWAAALYELRSVERDGRLSSLATALCAVCMYALGDPAWHTYACAAAYRSDDVEATRMARALLDAPHVAVRPAKPVPPIGAGRMTPPSRYAMGHAA
jgi:type III secretion protein HrpB1